MRASHSLLLSVIWAWGLVAAVQAGSPHESHANINPFFPAINMQSASKAFQAFDEAVRKQSADQRRMYIDIPYSPADKDQACEGYKARLKVR